jgi:hypothetical protein
MTRRRPMAARRLNTDGFPTLDAIAAMDYPELVETWCLIHDRRAAVPPGTNPDGTWSPRAMVKRLEQLALDDPSVIDTVAEVLAHERDANPNGPGDLVFAERALALAAVRAARFCTADGIAQRGPFRHVHLAATSPARERRRPQHP